MQEKADDIVSFWGMIYGLAFGLAVITGFALGFTGGHTPPVPFAIEIFIVPIGFFTMLIKYARNKPVKVHLWGLLANGGVLIFIICLALSSTY